jgi:class 3 adenylate cyclase
MLDTHPVKWVIVAEEDEEFCRAVGMAASTFLFTDIEGSTRLWERDAHAMRVALARHDGILARAASARNGRVFETIGDAFCITFESPADALRAALDAQRELLAGEPLFRVRMAIHTGEAEERGGDYFGAALSRVNRLLGAGHGGQILASSSAAKAFVDGAAPEGVEVRDLGERRLKDLPGSERIFQISADGLPDAFPPLRTLDARAGNLPAWPTPLVGRESEVAEIAGRIRGDARLLTLIGPAAPGRPASLSGRRRASWTSSRTACSSSRSPPSATIASSPRPSPPPSDSVGKGNFRPPSA